MFFNVLIDKIKKCLTCNLASISFFVGSSANLKVGTRKLHFL